MVRYEAHWNKDWEKAGITWVVVVRVRDEVAAEIGAFLVDAWCLGIKDAYHLELPLAAWLEERDEHVPPETSEAVEPACARKLVENAVAYGQSLGFLPHRDFRKARRVFGSIKTAQCPREFTFGRDGRPCYVTGPDDDDARINRVLAVLRARFGADGFDFIDQAAEGGADDEDARAAVTGEFFRFIDEQRGPNTALTSFEAQGFLAGVSLLPKPPPQEEWEKHLWDGGGAMPAYPDDATRALVEGGLIVLHSATALSFLEGDFDKAVPAADGLDVVEDSRHFAAGVLRALELRPKVAAWLRGHPEGREAFAVLDGLAPATGAPSAPAAGEEALLRSLADALASLHALAAELRGPPADAQG